MGNYRRLLDGEFDRSSPEYVERALSQAPEGTPIVGLVTAHPPSSLEELTKLFAEAHGHERQLGQEVGKFIELIALDSDPNQLVKRLPYDLDPPAGVWLILPETEF